MQFDPLKYPVGPYRAITEPEPEQIDAGMITIQKFPLHIRQAVSGLSPEQLIWRYRPKGWMIKQVVHHCADSHMNALIRFKLALTETQSVIRPYLEHKWAQLTDSIENDISASLQLIESVHQKWHLLLKNLTANQLELTYFHPEHGRTFTLKETIGQYAWHCEHHLGHVEHAKVAAGAYN